uniref:Ig-like domain-containing protein n=1 Tax=Maylandia zebra TaxID=106582 RepID=A0A3P9CSK0_9CICH
MKNSSVTNKSYSPCTKPSVSPMEVTAGDAVCLKCQVAGTPEIKVSWFKADGKVRSSPTCKLEYTKGVACLKLSKATKSDIGEYTCKAENRIGSFSRLLNLYLSKTPPSFPKKITSLQQTEGQPVRFECRVAGSLPIEVSWLKDGKPLSQGEEFSMLYDDNTAVLQINNSEMRHSGEYTCVATNKFRNGFQRGRCSKVNITFVCAGHQYKNKNKGDLFTNNINLQNLSEAESYGGPERPNGLKASAKAHTKHKQTKRQ